MASALYQADFTCSITEAALAAALGTFLLSRMVDFDQRGFLAPEFVYQVLRQDHVSLLGIDTADGKRARDYVRHVYSTHERDRALAPRFAEVLMRLCASVAHLDATRIDMSRQLYIADMRTVPSYIVPLPVRASVGARASTHAAPAAAPAAAHAPLTPDELDQVHARDAAKAERYAASMPMPLHSLVPDRLRLALSARLSVDAVRAATSAPTVRA